ncbi:hypothetical protein D9M71_738350 [compost metagenome]
MVSAVPNKRLVTTVCATVMFFLFEGKIKRGFKIRIIVGTIIKVANTLKSIAITINIASH